MKAPDFIPSRHLTALVAAALLLYLGAFLLANSPPGSSEAFAPPVMDHASQADSVMSGGGHPPSASYLAVSMEEAESADRHPVNAQLLTALLFLVGFLGSALALLKGRLLWNRCAVSFAGCPPTPPLQHSRQIRPAALLAVFRL